MVVRSRPPILARPFTWMTVHLNDRPLSSSWPSSLDYRLLDVHTESVTSDCIIFYLLLVVGTYKILMICQNVIYSRGSKFFFYRESNWFITWKRDERLCVTSQGVEFFFGCWVHRWRSMSRFVQVSALCCFGLGRVYISQAGILI